MKQNDALPFLHYMPELEPEFLKAFSLTRAQGTEPELAGHLYGILMKILNGSPLNIWEDSHIPEQLQKVANYMAEKSYANLTLEQFSAQAGMGKYHFCRMFKKYYGVSPMQYYMSKKYEIGIKCRRRGNSTRETKTDAPCRERQKRKRGPVLSYRPFI